MANISKYERQTKAQCLWDAFEGLKMESEIQGRNLVEMKAIVDLANGDERMQEFKDPIGEKSVYSKAKNSVYPPIVEAVNKWIENYKVDADKASNRCKQKIKKLDVKLASVEATVIKLEEKIHSLMTRLENKERIIEQTEKDRDDYAEELHHLRVKYEHA